MNEDGADVVEQGGGRRLFPSLNWPPMNWRPPRGAAILLAVGLVIGLGAGYALGYRQAPRNASPSPSASPASAPPVPAPGAISVTLEPVQGSGTVFSTGPGLIQTGPGLIQSTGTCAARSGRQLQLGVQVTNESPTPITLGEIRTVLPLGGLRVISQQWAPCGALGAATVPASLASGDSTWISVTVQVLVACPEPLPVQFTVGYTWPGGTASVKLPGFPDLTHVAYPGCTGS